MEKVILKDRISNNKKSAIGYKEYVDGHGFICSFCRLNRSVSSGGIDIVVQGNNMKVSADTGSGMISQSFEICYCPFCGEKLKRVKEIRLENEPKKRKEENLS